MKLDPTALRMLDANANRAVEGLRVAEDVARFALGDAALSGALKSLRHDLNAALRPIADLPRRAAARDTVGDVGTAISTPGESRRGGFSDIAAGGLGRAKEALRVLEEVAKLDAPESAARLEALRYRLYTVEKTLLTTLTRRASLAEARLYLIFTPSLCRRPPEDVLRGAIRGGVDLVQLREKQLSPRAYFEQARRWQALCRELDRPFAVNDHVDVAAALQADALHLGQDDLPPSVARRVVGARMLVGYSTHHVAQLQSPEAQAADYLGVGPAFATATKPHEPEAGLAFVEEAAASSPQPFFAIGGITRRRLPDVLQAGAFRVAVCGEICAADDPEAVARAFAEALAPPPEEA